MADDEKPKIQRLANPDLAWKRFHPLDAEGQALDERSLDEVWAEEREPDTPVQRRFSLALFIVLAIAIVAATIGIARRSDDVKVGPATSAYKSAVEREAVAKQTLLDFLNAQSTEQRSAHILDPVRLEAAVEEYYSREPKAVLRLSRIEETKLVEMNDQPWLWIKFSDTEGASHVAALKDTADGMKLDWESLVAYGEMSWARFCRERPPEPTQMRVYLEHCGYYNYKYSDSSKYAAFQIEPREVEQALYGYTERGTDSYRAVGASVVPGSRQPVNVRMHFEADAGAGNLVVIDELIHSLWTTPAILGVAGPDPPQASE